MTVKGLIHYALEVPDPTNGRVDAGTAQVPVVMS
jgi:hypothetical protein